MNLTLPSPNKKEYFLSYLPTIHFQKTDYSLKDSIFSFQKLFLFEFFFFENFNIFWKQHS
jgi:hypothetical protein